MFKFHKFYVLLLAAGFVLGGLNGCDKDGDGEGDGETTPGSNTMKVDGTLTDGEYGMVSNAEQLSVSFDDEETWAETVSVSAGKFSITLPKPDAKYLKLLDDGTVPEGVVISDKTAQYVSAEFYARKSGSYSTYVALQNYTGTSEIWVSYMYVDKNVSITGSYTEIEDGDTYVYNYNAQLKKGWNIMIENGTKAANGTWTYNLTANGNIPSGVKWIAP